MRRLAWVGLLGGATASTACQLIAGIQDRTADPIVDAPDSGAPVDAAPDTVVVPSGPWGCVQLPNEQLDPSLEVTATLQVFSAVQPSYGAGQVDGGSDLNTVSATWFPGVSVTSCALLDPGCAHGTPPVLTDDAGAATFHLTGAFSGFFSLSRSDLVPWSFYPGNLLAGATSTNLPTFGIDPTDFTILASQVTMAPPSFATDGGVGHTFVSVYDCEDHQAPGVALTYSTAGAETAVFYMKNGLPSTMATETDGFGIGGAINVPIGNLTVKATLVKGLMPVGSADVAIRPGALTHAFIRVRTH
jgi:hypothetical protein